MGLCVHINISPPYRPTPCLYGMALLTRKNNSPLSNKIKWCSLVNKISPNIHGDSDYTNHSRKIKLLSNPNINKKHLPSNLISHSAPPVNPCHLYTLLQAPFLLSSSPASTVNAAPQLARVQEVLSHPSTWALT